MPSLGAEAYSFRELGNAVTFSPSQNRSLSSVVVTMSSWGCQAGHWTTGDCLTTPGATFSEPITFNVYTANGTTLTPIASATQTFAVPFRPSASAKCGDGRWWDNALKSCFNGFATNITFSNFSYTGSTTLPDSIVFGIAYNTSSHGPTPLGYSNPCNATPAGCGYDSLNIALSSKTTDVSAGTAGSMWIDGIPSTTYEPSTPAVQIKASR